MTTRVTSYCHFLFYVSYVTFVTNVTNDSFHPRSNFRSLHPLSNFHSHHPLLNSIRSIRVQISVRSIRVLISIRSIRVQKQNEKSFDSEKLPLGHFFGVKTKNAGEKGGSLSNMKIISCVRFELDFRGQIFTRRRSIDVAM